jgi:hypothetical protein
MLPAWNICTIIGCQNAYQSSEKKKAKAVNQVKSSNHPALRKSVSELLPLRFGM